MEREIKKAVDAWKQANGKAKAKEHKGWGLLRGDNRPCNGVTGVRGKPYHR